MEFVFKYFDEKIFHLFSSPENLEIMKQINDKIEVKIDENAFDLVISLTICYYFRFFIELTFG